MKLFRQEVIGIKGNSSTNIVGNLLLMFFFVVVYIVLFLTLKIVEMPSVRQVTRDKSN